MKVEVKRISPDEFRNLMHDWNSLLQRSSSDSLFLSWEWMHTWWDTFKDGKALYILTVREDGQLIGIAPFCTVSGLFPGLRTLQFCSAQDLYPDYLDVIATAGKERLVIESTLRFLQDNSQDWTSIDLDNVPQNANLIGYGVEFMASHLEEVCVSSFCPYLRLNGSFDELLSRKFDKKKRYNLKRQEDILLNRKKLRYVKIVDDAGLSDKMDHLFDLHLKRAEARGIESTFRSRQIKSFHKRFSQLMLRRGSLDLHFLFDGDAPIGGTYSFQSSDKLYYFQTGFHPAWAQYSVGTGLLTLLMRYAFDQKLKEFDFLKGDEEYKKPWMNGQRAQYRIRLCKNDFIGRALARSSKIRSTIGRKLRSSRAMLSSKGIRAPLSVVSTFLGPAIRRVLDLIYRRTDVAILVHKGQNLPPTFEPFRITKSDATLIEDSVRLLMVQAGGWKNAEILRRRHQKDSYYAVLDGDRCVHYAWITRFSRILEEVDCSASLDGHDGWIYDCYTDPAYRGQGIFPRVLAHIVNEFRESGEFRIWVDVELTNRASLQAIQKAGFLQVCRAAKIVLFNGCTLKKLTPPMDEELGNRLKLLNFQ